MAYGTNWEEKYNRQAQHEMTPEEAYDMLEWEHNLLEDMRINRDRRRKYRKPFTRTLEEVTATLEHWKAQKQA